MEQDFGLPEQPVIACAPGTFALSVTDVDRTYDVLGLVLLDSGDYARSGGYGSPSEAALRFLADAPGLMAAQSQQLQQDRQDEQDSPREPRKTPSTLPCMVFQHFPIEQYYRLLKPVAATAARAIEGYRNFAGRHFVLNEDKTQPGSYLGRASAARMPTAANSQSLTRRDILRFPPGTTTATPSSVPCRSEPTVTGR